MRRPVAGEAYRVYSDAITRIREALDRGEITLDDYQRRLRAIDDWLGERRVCIVNDRAFASIVQGHRPKA
jgi:hypothetical protein